MLADDAVRLVLSSKQRPKPVERFSAEQNSLLAYVEWLAGHAGAAGRLRALRLVKAEVK